MSHRVFVKVVGFTDVERHALNTVFRLSEDEARGVAYSLWMPDAPEPPRLALMDGQSHEARLEAEAASQAGHKLIWVGEDAPAHAWRVFSRPLHWPHVVQAMDGLYGPPPEMDFDLGLGEDGDAPDTLPPEPGLPARRALIVSPDLEQRLYLRARLALQDMTQADEAVDAAHALELARGEAYAVALVDAALPDAEPWDFARRLRTAVPAIPHVILIKSGAGVAQRVRGWFAGTPMLDKPPHPGRLQALLQKI